MHAFSLVRTAGVVLGSLLLASSASAFFPKADIDVELEVIGRYHSTIYDEGGAEITAYSARHERLFVVNAAAAAVDVLDLSDPTQPTKIAAIDLSALGGGVNSVAVHRNRVAVAVEAVDPQQPGLIAFYNARTLALRHTVTVGALPDMVTFALGGRFALVANEGEPNDDYTIDPEGSISVIDLRRGLRRARVRTAGFGRFDPHAEALRAAGVRIFGPNASVSQDLEPEFITTQGRYAFVTLQENNAYAIVDILRARVLRIVPFGTKDHSLPGNELDPSNRDDAIAIDSWPTHGMYQPDAIDSFRIGYRSFLITANEGDARAYDGFDEETRVGSLPLDAASFPDAATLQLDENLGRLRTTNVDGKNEQGENEEIFSFGARSFSIWSPQGRLVYDSGAQLEVQTALALPDEFNSTNDDNDSFDSRSDDKGPEPEGVVVGRIGWRHFAFIGLERVGGIAVYDVSNPSAPEFEDYLNPRDFSQPTCLQLDSEGDCVTGPGNANPDAGDLGPEGLVFVPAYESPNGKPLLIVGNEVSGTTTVYQVNLKP